MATTYTWNFPALDVVFNEENMQNVVQTAHWIYSATDGEYSASQYGSVGLPVPSPEDFIPYDSLTEQIVEGWVVAALGQEQVDSMTKSLADNIESQKNPTSGQLPPPWQSA